MINYSRDTPKEFEADNVIISQKLTDSSIEGNDKR
jgi:hypothetical protein